MKQTYPLFPYSWGVPGGFHLHRQGRQKAPNSQPWTDKFVRHKEVCIYLWVPTSLEGKLWGSPALQQGVVSEVLPADLKRMIWDPESTGSYRLTKFRSLLPKDRALSLSHMCEMAQDDPLTEPCILGASTQVFPVSGLFHVFSSSTHLPYYHSDQGLGSEKGNSPKQVHFLSL